MDHEEALKKKLQHTLERVENQKYVCIICETNCRFMYHILNRMEQIDTLNKYSRIWAEYEKCYDSMEQVQEAKWKRAKLQSIEEESEW